MRFKTQIELVDEYGSNFRKITYFNSEGNMDHLFGSPVDSNLYNKAIHGFMPMIEGKWKIYPKMLTDKPLPQTDNADYTDVFDIGDKVEVSKLYDGIYRGTKGTVTDIDGDYCMVNFPSLELDVWVDIYYLKKPIRISQNKLLLV